MDLRAHVDRVDAKIGSLRTQLTALADEQALTSHDDEHDPEGVTIAVQRAQLQALLAGAERDRAELDLAAERIAAGTYGSCAVCGDPIAAERLEALPATRTCIVCATTRRGRQPGT
ncbi:TraR/DksA family transcriptional regulator [Pseudonocardia sp. HH130630-07]|uniref:TraR/DksA family transcriptional regulator n=1 Tax=Pseudonocardia sp. HH130630-07 TaxID=1690815 RepID=UPI0008151A6E|nr:TraR/DksA C4-type zinc finger protein [Pseudonocardia sp. HH130630-07]ANY06318.1 dksa/trar family transcriptional regulator [Pseudonocardia sp. HH130630-07]